MQYTIENEILKLTIDTKGAEMVQLIHKPSNQPLLWNAGPAWNRHAPMLFPYCGRLLHGKFVAKGKEYQGGGHGFVRDLEHKLVDQTQNSLTFEVCSDENTLAIFPYAFCFRTTYTLEGETVRHSVEVKNPGQEPLRFGFGYHPGFLCPFDENHDTEDYQLRFDIPQSPVVQDTPGGFCDGTHLLMENSDVIPLTDQLFKEDSICMTRLTAKTLSIEEKRTNRKVEVSIEGFPYVLAWSAATEKLQFVCIEPWHSLPDRVDSTGNWEEKPCAAVLQPGESWSTSMDMRFVR